MARKFRVGDVAEVKEHVRKQLSCPTSAFLVAHRWRGVINEVDEVMRRNLRPYRLDVGANYSLRYVYFFARELDLISRPKKGAK